jgi:hypothetical protein
MREMHYPDAEHNSDVPNERIPLTTADVACLMPQL